MMIFGTVMHLDSFNGFDQSGVTGDLQRISLKDVSSEADS